MIDVETETLVPIRDAAKHVPGFRPHLSVIYRWMQRSDGGLETVRVGGRVFTSKEAIARFVQHCNAPGAVAPSRRRRQELSATDRELSELGI